MIKKYMIFVACFIFFNLSYANDTACNNNPSLAKINEKDVVKLSGILHEVICWGPPNFGECPKIDQKFTAKHPLKLHFFFLGKAPSIPVWGKIFMMPFARPVIRLKRPTIYYEIISLA